MKREDFLSWAQDNIVVANYKNAVNTFDCVVDNGLNESLYVDMLKGNLMEATTSTKVILGKLRSRKSNSEFLRFTFQNATEIKPLLPSSIQMEIINMLRAKAMTIAEIGENLVTNELNFKRVSSAVNQAFKKGYLGRSIDGSRQNKGVGCRYKYIAKHFLFEGGLEE